MPCGRRRDKRLKHGTTRIALGVRSRRIFLVMMTIGSVLMRSVVVSVVRKGLADAVVGGQQECPTADPRDEAH